MKSILGIAVVAFAATQPVNAEEVSNPSPAPTASFTYKPNFAEAGTSVTLSWSSDNTTYCKNPWGTEIGTSGNYTFTSSDVGTVSYEFTCVGPAGTVTDTASYTLTVPKQPEIKNLRYSPKIAYLGQEQTFSFEYSNANKCYAYSNTGREIIYYEGEQKDGIYSWTSPPRNALVDNQAVEVTCEGRGGVSYKTTYFSVTEHPTVSGLKKTFESIASRKWVNSINCDTEITFKNSTQKVCDVKNMYWASLRIDGLLDLYLASGDEALPELALEISEKYQSIGQYRNNGEYLTWFSTPKYEVREKGDDIETFYNHFHYEWRAGIGVARTIATILGDPKLSALHARAKRLQTFAEKHIWQKWYSRYSQFRGVRVTHFIGRIASIALFLNKHSSNITLKKQYKEVIESRSKVLKGGLELVSIDGVEAYNIRCYAPENGEGVKDCSSKNLPTVKTIDVSHAGDTVSFIVEAYLDEEFKVFNEQDIRRLTNTVKKLIISDRDNLFFSNVCSIDKCSNNSNDDKDSNTDPYYGKKGAYQSQWAKLAQFDPALLDIYLYWLSTKNIDVSPCSMPETKVSSDQTLPEKYGTPSILGNLALATVRTYSQDKCSF